MHKQSQNWSGMQYPFNTLANVKSEKSEFRFVAICSFPCIIVVSDFNNDLPSNCFSDVGRPVDILKDHVDYKPTGRSMCPVVEKVERQTLKCCQ